LSVALFVAGNVPEPKAKAAPKKRLKKTGGTKKKTGLKVKK
jgi:hypothetical protein